MSTEFTTMEFIESAGAPIGLISISSEDKFVPAITNITSFSNWILSRIAASGDIKLGFIFNFEPKDKFHTLMSLFAATI